MSRPFDPSRRSLLRGRVRSEPSPLRPPWALPEDAFIDLCHRCDACIEACPERILRHDDDRGHPRIDFTQGSCVFCRQCQQACPTSALSTIEPPRWLARIGRDCLAERRIVCQSCAEQCEQGAIRFRLWIGGVGQPEVMSEACTGCGACVAPCPTGAIEIIDEARI